jgi:drug/metabolite transporter (DMT)-like permease
MCVIWGIPYLLIKVAVADVTPLTLVFFRTLVGALLLTPLAVWRGALVPLRAHWRWLLVYTFVEVAIPWPLLAGAETRMSSSLTGLLIGSVPLFGVVLARLSGAEDRFGGRRLAGLLIGLAGVAAVVGLNLSTRDVVAVVELGAVALGYALGPLIIARKMSDLPTIGVVAVSLILPAILFAPAGIAQAPASMPAAKVIIAIVLLGVVCTALAFLIFFALIAETGPVRATMITYVNPAVAVVLGVVFLGESFTFGEGVGFALILTGLVLATRVPASDPAAETELATLAAG